MKMMGTAAFTPGHAEEIAALVPAELARIAELRREGTIETVYIGADEAHFWVVLHGESEEAIRRAVATLPFAPFMETTYTEIKG